MLTIISLYVTGSSIILLLIVADIQGLTSLPLRHCFGCGSDGSTYFQVQVLKFSHNTCMSSRYIQLLIRRTPRQIIMMYNTSQQTPYEQSSKTFQRHYYDDVMIATYFSALIIIVQKTDAKLQQLQIYSIPGSNSIFNTAAHEAMQYTLA